MTNEANSNPVLTPVVKLFDSVELTLKVIHYAHIKQERR